jgi:MscS family membrane protein
LLSIPAGTLSQSNVENLSARAKTLIQSRLRLRYGTSPGQVRAVLGAIARLMAGNERLEQETARVRLVEFSDRAIELELFAYANTPDNEQFLQVREELLLGVATIVESLGAGFAQPTQFVYMDREADLDVPRPGDSVSAPRVEAPADVAARPRTREAGRPT